MKESAHKMKNIIETSFFQAEIIQPATILDRIHNLSNDIR